MRTAAVALTLVAPVSGPVARAFEYGVDPFRAGQHRGVDLAARPGAVARAACSGRVATARLRVVTLRCGAWRVTHLPLATISVRRGTRVHAGQPVGHVGTDPGHTGLHLGVRRASDPLGYIDPLPLLRGVRLRPPVTAAPRRGVPREPPSAPPALVPAQRRPVTAPLSRPESARVRVLAPARARLLAPWPAWVGLVLLLLGAVGGGVRIRARRRLVGLAHPAVGRVPSPP